MTDSVIPITVQELLSRLEFIAQQGRHTKPCVNRRAFVAADSWSGAFIRFTCGESRRGLIVFLKNMLDDYQVVVRDYADHIDLLKGSLVRASEGIKHLFDTYRDSPDTLAELAVIMMIIDKHISP